MDGRTQSSMGLLSGRRCGRRGNADSRLCATVGWEGWIMIAVRFTPNQRAPRACLTLRVTNQEIDYRRHCRRPGDRSRAPAQDAVSIPRRSQSDKVYYIIHDEIVEGRDVDDIDS